ncbi:two-component system, NarL family, sensor histidine kinase BarA [Acinetobacter marinus]|uniref:histidine kinase n=1 Tax=Acinetobacter marinus TaxID=281375 RepID=A0A1G6HT50_9GAMM|nr:response regulator [Acinetobacter marinus]SDB97477.1 two-component system, NarL family, sensor histidine kinase BarA [Acinetobacter marinus]
MQQRSESFWHRFKISNAYGQLIALIFLPIMILALAGAYIVLQETSRSMQSQQITAASAVLTRYQKTASILLKLDHTSIAKHAEAQHILQYMLNEPDVIRAALVNVHGMAQISVGHRNHRAWPAFPVDSDFFGPIQFDDNHIYGMRIGYSAQGPVWLMIEMDNQPLTLAKYRVWLVLVATGLFTLLLLLLCLNFYARRWIAPMYEIRLQLQRMNADSLGKSFQTNSTGELALLQKDIATLLRRLNFSFLELKEHTEQTEDDLRKTLDTLEVQNITYKKARDQAISANQSKSVFLANISHELRTPLNSIDGFIHLMLRRGQLNDENQLYVQTIRKSSAHLLALINDVLDFSKIDAGKLELEVANFNLEEAIFDVMDMLSPLASEKQIDMAIYYDHDLPFQVCGDILRFKQVLTNLVSNAIKFTPEGDIIVRTRLEHQDANRITMHCTVQDSGIGLSGTDRKKLFASFSQGDTSVTRQFGGTGLGLAISKQLVQLMHGQIGFEDNQERNPTEKGATFWFNVQFELPDEQPQLESVMSQFNVLSYIAHPATANIFKQYLEDYDAAHHECSSILDLFSRLKQFNGLGEKAWVIVDHSSDLDALLQEIRTRYQGNLAIYGYQMLLDPQILQTHQALALNQPLSRQNLLKLFFNQTQTTSAPVFNGQGLHVLAVDDHLPNLVVLEALLNELNVEVTTALNGQNALNRIQERLDKNQPLFDLVFMDIQMPVMSGPETTQAIRGMEHHATQTHQLPIIALTAHAMSDEKEHLMQAGFNDYVTKPIQLEQLMQILSTWTKADQLQTIDSHVNAPSLATPEMSIQSTHYNHIASDHTNDVILDWNLSLQLAANKADLAQDLLRMLIDSFDDEQSDMEQLIELEDFPQLEQNLHRIYGATRYVGTPQLQQLTGEFEQFVSILRKEQRPADDDFIEQVLQRYNALLEAMSHVRIAAQEYL